MTEVGIAANLLGEAGDLLVDARVVGSVLDGAILNVHVPSVPWCAPCVRPLDR